MAVQAVAPTPSREAQGLRAEPDWRKVARLMHTSRALDEIEETRLVPERKVLYQFSARGHELPQILLGLHLSDAHDGVAVYYRSRPLMLTLGVSAEDAAAGPLMRADSFSGGRDIGVVFNRPGRGGPTVLPACGGVGTQYTPAAGWAQAIRYRRDTLADPSYARSIAVVLGGDASTATNGFWSALNIATTQQLPLLIFIEDNGYGISVPSRLQTPGGNIAANLRSFSGLTILEGDGSDPAQVAALAQQAVERVRERARAAAAAADGAAPVRAFRPGHAGIQVAAALGEERARDPLRRPARATGAGGDDRRRSGCSVAGDARSEVEGAIRRALARAQPDPRHLTRHVFSAAAGVAAALQEQGGLAPEGHRHARSSAVARTRR